MNEDRMTALETAKLFAENLDPASQDGQALVAIAHAAIAMAEQLAKQTAAISELRTAINALPRDI